MKNQFNIISEKEFNSFSNYPILFQDREMFNRSFGLLNSDKQIYRIAWHSNTINPLINELKDNICSVGVDQNFAIIDFNKKKVILNLNLFYNFFTVKNIKERIFIITELEIIELNNNDFQVISHYDLPDIFEEMTINGEFIDVLCMENIKIRIPF